MLAPRRPHGGQKVPPPLYPDPAPGTYLRIVEEGDIGAGDEIRVVERPDHDLTIRDVFRIFSRDRHEVERLLPIPRLSDAWKAWAEKRLQAVAERDTDSSDAPGCC